MLNVGDKKSFIKIVSQEDIAAFPDQLVHEVYSTFALARDVEWSSRLFVLDEKEDDEEGIGILLEINHLNPALVGEQIELEAKVISFSKKVLFCDIVVKVGERLIATAKTGQKIIKKEKFKNIISGLKNKG